MGESTLKDKTAKGLFWGGMSNGVQQLLSLFFGIFLARLLTPSDYGLVGMLSIFSALAAILQDSGFTIALINKDSVRHEDYNAVFWFNILVAIACYVILFFCAPLIARFFHKPELVLLSRWSFLAFLISSFGTSHSAMLTKKLMIREKAISNILALGISGTVGVILAFKGYAYWAIVIQTLILVTILTVCYWAFSGWKPTLPCKFAPISGMFKFGSKILITNVADSVGTYLLSIVFGRYYTEKEVGYFNQANKWNSMGYGIIKGMVGSVAQPVLVEVKEERERLLRVFRKLVRFTAFFSFPAMLGLAFIAPEFITIAITDKWAESAKLMQILCVGGAFIPLSHLFSNLVLSREQSSRYMWSTIALVLVQIAITIAVYPRGITAMVIAYSLIYILWLFVWFILVRKSIPYSLWGLLSDIIPFLGISLVAIVSVLFATRWITNIYWLLVAKVFLVAALYIGIMWLFQAVTLKECIKFIRNKLKRQSS